MIISFLPLTGFAIIVYIIYRNIKNKTIKTFTINSHQDDTNIYKGGDMFKEKKRVIKPSWNKFTLAFFVLYIIVLYSKSPVWVAWFQAIFPPYLIIYLIVKLVKWHRGLDSTKINNNFAEMFPNDPVFHHDDALNPSFPCTGLNIFTDDDD